MAKIKINKTRCKGCRLCVLYCPNKLIHMSDLINARGVNFAVFSNKGGCTGCLSCALICPDCAIEVFK